MRAALGDAAADSCWAGAQSHCVTLASTPGHGTVLIATGNGSLGAVFGLYALSEAVLGAPTPPHPPQCVRIRF